MILEGLKEYIEISINQQGNYSSFKMRGYQVVSLDSFTLELYTVIPPPLLLLVPMTIVQVLLEKLRNPLQICIH
jgi:hypothetical protein